MFYIKNKFLNLFQYRVLPKVETILQNWRHQTFQDIGIKVNKKSAPRALVIYLSSAIPYLISGDMFSCPLIDDNALVWESAELVRILIEKGYVVDFVDCYSEQPVIDWHKYELVFDERNNLINAPLVKGQQKVFIASGLPWSFHNSSEIRRINEFYERTKIWVTPARIIKPIFSDELADFIIYKGREEWMSKFASKPRRVQLNKSAYEPKNIARKFTGSHFLWMGSVGAVHKGLDLAVEAFKELPETTLHIFGNIQGNSSFFHWLMQTMEKYPNIKYYGWANVSDQKFQKIAFECIGHVFPSCSENGAGSVAQTSLFGIIPITTNTANTRSAHLGYVINDFEAEAIIREIKRIVKDICDLSEAELKLKSDQLMEFSRQVHTRAAYSQSVEQFLQLVNE